MRTEAYALDLDGALLAQMAGNTGNAVALLYVQLCKDDGTLVKVAHKISLLLDSEAGMVLCKECDSKIANLDMAFCSDAL